MEEEEQCVDEERFPGRLVAFKKRSGTTDHGKEYEVLVISLVLLRALRLTRQFWLASNHSKAGAFDDVVLLWKNADEETLSCCLIQLKHKATFVLTKSALLSTSTKKNDFGILKYFKSFLEISDYWGYEILPIQTATYALYTNAPLKPRLQLVDADEPDFIRKILGTGNGRVASLLGHAEVETLLGSFGDSEQVQEFLEKFSLWYDQAGPDELRSCLRECDGSLWPNAAAPTNGLYCVTIQRIS